MKKNAFQGIVGAVLRTIQSLGNQPALRPLASRLLCELWRRQDRCYPQLVKFLTDPPHPDPSHEMLVARAATIRDICHIKSVNS